MLLKHSANMHPMCFSGTFQKLTKTATCTALAQSHFSTTTVLEELCRFPENVVFGIRTHPKAHWLMLCKKWYFDITVTGQSTVTHSRKPTAPPRNRMWHGSEVHTMPERQRCAVSTHPVARRRDVLCGPLVYCEPGPLLPLLRCSL